MRGTIDVFVGAILVTLGWYWRAQREEETMRETVGAAAYDEYAARTPMLVPFTR